jgi:hypothetical protein
MGRLLALTSIYLRLLETFVDTSPALNLSHESFETFEKAYTGWLLVLLALPLVFSCV